MSQVIEGVLRHYREIETVSPESELIHLKADIDRALRNAPLDEEEKAVIQFLYLTDPIQYPVRKLNKNGGESGRPLGGTTQGLVAGLVVEDDKSSNAKNIRISRTLKGAIQKIEEYLGEGYDG